MNNMTRDPSWKAVSWIARVFISFWIALIFFHSPGVNGYWPAEYHDMVTGKAYRPFVTRALMPWTIRTVVAATPEKAKTAIAEGLEHSWYVNNELHWKPYYYEYLVGYLLSVFCLVAFSLVCRSFWRSFLTPPHPYGEMFSIVALLGLPLLFKYYSYIYDFPTLFLYTLCLLLLARRNWVMYFPVFFLSCVNKETAILLPVVFALYYIVHHRDDRHIYWLFLTGQVVLAVLVRGGIAFLYRDNPGSALESHFLYHNLPLLTVPPSVETSVTWLLLITVVLHQWWTKPWLLRVAVSMLVPLLSLCLFFGSLDELRDYYEVYAPALMLGAISFLRLLGYAIRTLTPSTPSSVGRIRAAADAPPEDPDGISVS